MIFDNDLLGFDPTTLMPAMGVGVGAPLQAGRVPFAARPTPVYNYLPNPDLVDLLGTGTITTTTPNWKTVVTSGHTATYLPEGGIQTVQSTAASVQAQLRYGVQTNGLSTSQAIPMDIADDGIVVGMAVAGGSTSLRAEITLFLYDIDSVATTYSAQVSLFGQPLEEDLSVTFNAMPAGFYYVGIEVKVSAFSGTATETLTFTRAKVTTPDVGVFVSVPSPYYQDAQWQGTPNNSPVVGATSVAYCLGRSIGLDGFWDIAAEELVMATQRTLFVAGHNSPGSDFIVRLGWEQLLFSGTTVSTLNSGFTWDQGAPIETVALVSEGDQVTLYVDGWAVETRTYTPPETFYVAIATEGVGVLRYAGIWSTALNGDEEIPEISFHPQSLRGRLVGWDYPAANGGSQIDRYRVETSNGAYVSVYEIPNAVTMYEIPADQVDAVQVRAGNSVGWSTPAVATVA